MTSARLFGLLGACIFALSCSSPPSVPPRIESVSPPVGWASTATGNGTLVTIGGAGFHPDPGANVVTFTNGARAPVLRTGSGRSRFEFVRAFGGPGNAPGELTFVTAIAIDRQERVYVADQADDGGRVQVFERGGRFLRSFGEGELHHPRGIAVDASGRVFVADQTANAGGRVAVFDARGRLQLTLGAGTLGRPRDIALDGQGGVYVADPAPVFGGPAVFRFSGGVAVALPAAAGAAFDVPTGLTYHAPSRTLSVTDPGLQAVVLYRHNLPIAVRDFSAAGGACKSLQGVATSGAAVGCTPLAVAATDDGGLVMSLTSGPQVFLLDRDGLLLTRDIPEADDAVAAIGSPVGVAVTPFSSVYVLDSVCQCVRQYDSAGRQELTVRVPAGAQSGRISVRTALGMTQTEMDFDVLIAGEPPGVEKTELTQGIGSYPLVSGKDTLLWARLDGPFGVPGRDEITVTLLALPDGMMRQYTWSKEPSAFRLDHDRQSGRTTVSLRIPARLARNDGDLAAAIRFTRDELQLANGHWSASLPIVRRRTLELLFVKFTDVPEAQWRGRDPTPWFDMTDFVAGMAAANRMLPVADLTYRFAETRYLDYLGDGVQDAETCEVGGTQLAARRALNEYRNRHPNDPVFRAIGLLDPLLNDTRAPKALGWSCGLRDTDTVVTFFESADAAGRDRTWGATLAHELVHSFGLVARDAPNYDPQRDDPGHSRNRGLDAEQGAPVDLWNTRTGQRVPLPLAGSLMGAPGVANGNAFLESTSRADEALDYRLLFERMRP